MVQPNDLTESLYNAAESSRELPDLPELPTEAELVISPEGKEAENADVEEFAKAKADNSGAPDDFIQEEAISTQPVEPGLETPLIDPITVATGASGATAKLAVSAGRSILSVAGRAISSGVISGAAEFPVGFATEQIGRIYPSLRLPFNLLLGFLSGATIEKALEKGILKNGTKIVKGIRKAIAGGQDEAEAITEATTKALTSDPEGLADIATAAKKELGDVSPQAEKAASLGQNAEARAVQIGVLDPLEAAARRAEREGEAIAQKVSAQARVNAEESLGKALEKKGDVLDSQMAFSRKDMAQADMANEAKKLSRVAKAQVVVDGIPDGPGTKLTDDQIVDFKAAIKHGSLEDAIDFVAKDFNVEKFETTDALVTIGAYAEMLAPAMAKAKGGAVETFKQVESQSAKLLDEGEEAVTKVLTELWGQTKQLSAKMKASHMVMQGAHKAAVDHAYTMEGKAIEEITALEFADFIRLSERAADIQLMMKGVVTNVARGVASQRIVKGVAQFADEVPGVVKKAKAAGVKALDRVKTAAPDVPSSPKRAKGARVDTSEDVIARAGGRKKIKGLIEILIADDMKDGLAGAGRQIRVIGSRNIPDRVVGAIIGGMISGQDTQRTNILGNTTMMLFQPTTDLAAGVVNKYILKNKDGISPEDAVEEFKAIFGGLYESMLVVGRGVGMDINPDKFLPNNPMTNAVTAFRTGLPQFGVKNVKMDIPYQSAADDRSFAMGLRWVENVLRPFSNTLLGADEFAKAMTARMEGRRIASMYLRGLDMKDLDRAVEIDAMMRNPTDAMMEQMIAAAAKNTFTGQLESKLGKVFQDFSNAHPLTKLIAPFVRIPARIFDETIKTGPFAVLQKSVRNTIMNGTIVEKQRVFAQIALGTSFFFGVNALVAGGYIIGSKGGTPEAIKAGMQPYSWVSTDENGKKHYTRLDRIEPFGSILAIATDTNEAYGKLSEGELGEAASIYMLAWYNMATSRTFMNGSTRLISTFEDARRAGAKGGEIVAKFLQRSVAGFVVPAVLSQVRKDVDPIMRQARDLTDLIINRIPVASSSLDAQLNFFGEEVPYPRGADILTANPLRVAEGIASPLKTSTESDSPALVEFARLRNKTDAEFRMPLDKLSENVELTGKGEYNEYIQLINKGGTFKKELNALVQSKDYLAVPDEGKVEMLRMHISIAKERGRLELFDRHPDMETQFYRDQENSIRRKVGEPELPAVREGSGILSALSEFFGA